MFQKGDKIHTHDGKVHTVRSRSGKLPKSLWKNEQPRMRGFVRGALVDCLSGETQTGDYHENVVTTYGYNAAARAFAGLASSANSAAATVLSDLGLAKYWGIGYMTQAQSSNFSTMSAIDSTEWATASTGGTARATVSAGTQGISGTGTLVQQFQYVSTALSNAQ